MAPGEHVLLQGENGAGKSTLLRLVATMVRPTAGTVEVAGTDARRDPEQARRALSILVQESPLYPELSPREHLRWWARAQGALNPPGLLASAGLDGHADVPARNLSRGQRQRVALAMALLPDRPLLLLDEPFASLDDAGARWLRRELDARGGRQALVVAAHGPDPIAADRVLRLSGGRLLEAR